MQKRKAWYRTSTFDSWDALEDQLEGYYLDRGSNDENRWIFRGSPNKSYGLLTSLERALASNPYWATEPAAAERLLIREYKKRAHDYIRGFDMETPEIEWLALMQHHGAPTRLLDWTRSPYVALFFALRDFGSTGAIPAVWVLNIDYCTRVAIESFRNALRLKEAPRPEHLFDLSRKKVLPVVFPIEPQRANTRLSIQQGILLYPGDVAKSFDENLSRGVGMDEMLRLEIGRELAPIGLHRLSMMNISHATLFPGIDGFSASMRELLWTTEHLTISQMNSAT